jgi:hypothetical protein
VNNESKSVYHQSFQTYQTKIIDIHIYQSVYVRSEVSLGAYYYVDSRYTQHVTLSSALLRTIPSLPFSLSLPGKILIIAAHTTQSSTSTRPLPLTIHATRNMPKHAPPHSNTGWVNTYVRRRVFTTTVTCLVIATPNDVE